MTDEVRMLAALQRDIAYRLRPLCPNLSDAAFDQLVRDIATVKLKYGVEAEVASSLREHLESVLSERHDRPVQRSA